LHTAIEGTLQRRGGGLIGTTRTVYCPSTLRPHAMSWLDIYLLVLFLTLIGLVAYKLKS
jgi:hypothetical protein